MSSRLAIFCLGRGNEQSGPSQSSKVAIDMCSCRSRLSPSDAMIDAVITAILVEPGAILMLWQARQCARFRCYWNGNRKPVPLSLGRSEVSPAQMLLALVRVDGSALSRMKTLLEFLLDPHSIPMAYSPWYCTKAECSSSQS